MTYYFNIRIHVFYSHCTLKCSFSSIMKRQRQQLSTTIGSNDYVAHIKTYDVDNKKASDHLAMNTS